MIYLSNKIKKDKRICMDKKTLKSIEKTLFTMKKDFEKELGAIAKKDMEKIGTYKSRYPDYGEKEDENATEVAVFSDRLAIEETLEKDLRDVNKAIENIKKGTYGICKYCKKPIDEKRLRIRPESSSCVECKRRLKGE